MINYYSLSLTNDFLIDLLTNPKQETSIAIFVYSDIEDLKCFPKEQVAAIFREMLYNGSYSLKQDDKTWYLDPSEMDMFVCEKDKRPPISSADCRDALSKSLDNKFIGDYIVVYRSLCNSIETLFILRSIEITGGMSIISNGYRWLVKDRIMRQFNI